MKISPLDVSFLGEILPFIFSLQRDGSPFFCSANIYFLRPLRNFTFKTHSFTPHLKLSLFDQSDVQKKGKTTKIKKDKKKAKK